MMAVLVAATAWWWLSRNAADMSEGHAVLNGVEYPVEPSFVYAPPAPGDPDNTPLQSTLYAAPEPLSAGHQPASLVQAGELRYLYDWEPRELIGSLRQNTSAARERSRSIAAFLQQKPLSANFAIATELADLFDLRQEEFDPIRLSRSVVSLSTHWQRLRKIKDDQRLSRQPGGPETIVPVLDDIATSIEDLQDPRLLQRFLLGHSSTVLGRPYSVAPGIVGVSSLNLFSLGLILAQEDPERARTFIRAGLILRSAYALTPDLHTLPDAWYKGDHPGLERQTSLSITYVAGRLAAICHPNDPPSADRLAEALAQHLALATACSSRGNRHIYNLQVLSELLFDWPKEVEQVDSRNTRRLSEDQFSVAREACATLVVSVPLDVPIYSKTFVITLRDLKSAALAAGDERVVELVDDTLSEIIERTGSPTVSRWAAEISSSTTPESRWHDFLFNPSLEL
jgi:hypothetical protein